MTKIAKICGNCKATPVNLVSDDKSQVIAELQKIFEVVKVPRAFPKERPFRQLINRAIALYFELRVPGSLAALAEYTLPEKTFEILVAMRYEIGKSDAGIIPVNANKWKVGQNPVK